MSGPDFSAPGQWPPTTSGGQVGPPWPSSAVPPPYRPGPPVPPAGQVAPGHHSPTSFDPNRPAAYGPGSPTLPAHPGATTAYGGTLPIPPRPVAIPVTICMTVTAGLLWPCALALAWLLALAGEQQLSASSQDVDSRTVLLLNHFSARLLDGLALPLFGFPLVAVVLAFLLVIRRPWPRILYTAWGALTLAWLGWWLQDNLLVALSPAIFIVIAVLLVWLPSVGTWLARRDPQPPLTPLSGGAAVVVR